jgi:hypothetical protein
MSWKFTVAGWNFEVDLEGMLVSPPQVEATPLRVETETSEPARKFSLAAQTATEETEEQAWAC